MRIKYLQTFLFLLAILLLVFVPNWNKDIAKGREIIHSESENARWLYTGKTRDVYDPLDKAYVVTDKLKEMILEEEKLDFSNYQELPVVSVWIDPKDLNDEDRGIWANPLKKGRLWERASYISYYEKGVKKFSSFAGVRIHGGRSREHKVKSLRLNFKRKYGEPYFYNSKSHSVILRRENAPYVNDFSYSLINRLGGMAPTIQQIDVFLNGEFYQVLHLVEHQNRRHLERDLGHKNFIYYKLRGNNSQIGSLFYEKSMDRLEKLKGEALVSYVKSEFDLDNLIPWFLTVGYFGMYDWAQGVWFKDLQFHNPKWKLIAWDFDFAFSNEAKRSSQAWEISGTYVLNLDIDSLPGQLIRTILTEPELKNLLFSRLPAFCEVVEKYYQEKFAEYQNVPEQITAFYEKRDCLNIFID